jgi:hypothetical protein
MSNEVVCTACGHVGTPVRITKGSIWIEILLWLCLLLPGLIYSIWRISSRYDACRSCGLTAIIPRNSPMGQKFIRENFPEQATAIADGRRPSDAAQSMGRSIGRLVGRVFK